MNNNCCKECGRTDEGFNWYCGDVFCICHSPAGEGVKDGRDEFFRLVQAGHPSDSIEGIVAEFKRNFPALLGVLESTELYGVKMATHLENWLRSRLSSFEATVRKDEVEALRKAGWLKRMDDIPSN